MNGQSEFAALALVIGLLAAEIAVVVGIAALGARWTKSASWRRAIWHVCLLAIAGLAVCELSGTGRGLAAWAAKRSEPRPPLTRSAVESAGNPEAPTPSGSTSVSDIFRRQVAERLVHNRAAKQSEQLKPSTTASAPENAETASGALGAQADRPAASVWARETPTDALAAMPLTFLGMVLVWLLGAGVLVGRVCFSRSLFVFFHWRQRVPPSSELLAQVGPLALCLGLHRPVRVFVSARLSGPVACGVVRPTVGLPEQFCDNFTVAQRQAILAHELAHLAAHDPAWRLLADLVAAALWWHPLVWWTRYQLHAASEAAADEASLLVAHGPHLLAESLVTLAGQLTRSPSLSWLGIEGNGFRSGLGQRVERLMNLASGSWSPPSRLRAGLARTLGAPALILAAIFCTAWATPQAPTTGTTMKTIRHTWKQSLAAFTLLAGLSGDNGEALAATQRVDVNRHPPIVVAQAQPVPPTAVLPADSPPSPVASQPPTASESEESPRTLMDPRMMMRYFPQMFQMMQQQTATASNSTQSAKRGQALREKLEKFIIAETPPFQGLPLSEVVDYLSGEVKKRDPDKQGVNFIISNQPDGQAGAQTIDPTTGVPVLQALSVELKGISIALPPLSNVSAKALLDAIIQVADQPIQYSFLDYGVLLSPDPKRLPPQTAAVPSAPAAPAPLQIRTFRIDMDNLRAGLESAFGINLDEMAEEVKPPPASGQKAASRKDQPPVVAESAAPKPLTKVEDAYEQQARMERKKRLETLATPERAERSRAVQAALRKLLADLGLNFEAPGKLLFYNQLTSILMVRATFEDLEVVQAVVETLGGTAPGLGAPMGGYGMPGAAPSPYGARNAPAAGLTPSFMRQQEAEEAAVVRQEAAILQREKEAELVRLTSKYTEDDPQVVSLREEIERLKARAALPTPNPFFGSQVAGPRRGTDLGPADPATTSSSGSEDQEKPKRTVSVLGAVNKPGIVALPTDQKWTLLDALAAAGGLNRVASKSRIELIRKGETSKFRFEDLKKTNDSSKSPSLEAEDIIVVPEVVY
ncbi:MAG: SLBB domain-containing protein [Verrucomicrobia bacterium]|nr:SLBB domain-containing protein [Verrucomicrobiota bacterium]